MIKLQEKVKRLEALNHENQQFLEIQKHLADSLYQDEKEKAEKQAQLQAEQNKESDLNNLIRDDTSHSQQDAELEQPTRNLDLAEERHDAGPALSENLNTNNLEFTVHQEQPKVTDTKANGGPAAEKDFVNATLAAWNQCPGIVKKQLDQQHDEIKSLKEKLKAATVRLNQRKAEFERHAAVEMKVQLLKHKDHIENAFRQKLEDEKKNMLKNKVEEMDMILQENFHLKKELMALKKGQEKKPFKMK